MPHPTWKSLLFGALVLTAACKRGDDAAQASPPATAAAMNGDPAQNTYDPKLGVTLAQFTKRPSGLYVIDVAPGTGPEAVAGKTVKVHYTGWLANGKQFDSSKGGEPIEFPLGQGVGFAGIENPLFFRDNTNMIYGDAKKVASGLITEVKAMDDSH